ncbi:hypothetical protein Tco_0801271 [Tanacetum coccineum]|uniref:DUF4283 domain-containing protein n=1 Tax=Tanacetum coccineum TaxID=301880 RepID=A0ABQ4ZVL4_9ASTR
MYKLTKKLKKLKRTLNKLSWYQGYVYENARMLKEELKTDQEVVDRNPFDVNARIKAAQTLSDLIDASNDKINLLHQKAKINWLKDGDKNTAFFHSMIKARRNKNRVESIRDEKGNFYKGNKVSKQFVKHFKKFLGESNHVAPIADTYFKRKVSNEEAQCMVKEVSDKEIKEAIFDIDSNKDDGLDGYIYEFFKSAWDIVGNDVCLAVKEFFKNGKLLGEINATLIALIPKFLLLTRHIQDNILLYQELLRGYSKKNGPKRCAMQVDIQKDYDTGGKGLRQGDPISPYLFYTGDGGNKGSVEVIKRSMEEFSKVSGLAPNLGKCTIFFGSIKDNEKQELLDILPFKYGRLPVRYLGVPLLDKRIQLLASVLSSMQNYWASVYLLPSAVVKELDKLFKRFLWNSGESAQGKSRVSLKLVCRPKEQGGLGIKPLKKWNEVLLIRQFWKIIENKESLWAKWVNLVKLKKKSIWNVQMDKSDSWGWKTMLKIRDAVKNHVWYNIRNGKSIYVFYDEWCSYGPLSEKISRRSIYDERINEDICSYTLKVWNGIMDVTQNLGRQSNLDDIVNLIANGKTANSIKIVINKLLLAATVYYLWQERNQRTFKGECRKKEELCKIIKGTIKSKLMSLRVKKSNNVMKIAPIWDLGWRGGKKKKNNNNDTLKDIVMVSSNGDELNKALGANPDTSTPKVVNEVGMNDVGTGPAILTLNPSKSSSYADVTGKPSRTKVAYPVVANYVRNTWGKYEDAGIVPVWVKLHGVPVTAFIKDGLSAISTKLGTPLMLDSYTSDMCMQSWGRSRYARAMIELQTDVELKDNIVLNMPKITGDGFYTCNIRVVYEWKPPRCACCKVFGHVQKECLKNIGAGETKNLKKPSQTPKGVPVGQKANSSGSSFWNVDSSSPSTTPIIEKIDNIEKLIIHGKVTLMDDEGKPLEKVVSLGDYDSEDEVASIDNKMASFLAKKNGYGTRSLLE